MLRIDETSKTLVAPAGALVAESGPDRDELLVLLRSSWDAFAQELGAHGLRLVAADPAPGVDLLAYDEWARRPVVVQVSASVDAAELGRGLAAAAHVAGWDGAQLTAVDHTLSGATPGDSPRLVFVTGDLELDSEAAIAWLSGRHGVDLAAFAVSFLRLGAERLLSVRQVHPAVEAAADPIAELFGEPAVATAPAAAPAPLVVGSTPAARPVAQSAWTSVSTSLTEDFASPNSIDVFGS